MLRLLLAAFSRIETAQIEVASSLGDGAARIIARIILPAALPALLAGGSLCLEFGIVFFIGAKGVIALPLLIYDKAIQEFDYTSACVIATVNVALLLGLFTLYRLVLSRLGARVLVWSRWGRAAAWTVFALQFGVVYLAPVALIVVASFTGQWNGVLPSDFGLGNYRVVLSGTPADQLRVSLITGVAASCTALALATLAALAPRGMRRLSGWLLGTLFYLPSAVPSVSVGLGLLVAFSQKPVLLNGTILIVLVAHLVLVSAFTFGNVSSGLARLPADCEQVAESPGATPAYRLRRVTLPLLAPYLVAAFSLSFALSMGELGATIMVYPPGWVTLPVCISGLTDRGDVFQVAALTVVLATATLLVLLALSRLPLRAAAR